MVSTSYNTGSFIISIFNTGFTGIVKTFCDIKVIFLSICSCPEKDSLVVYKAMRELSCVVLVLPFAL